MSDGRPFSLLAHPKTVHVCVSKSRKTAWAAENPADRPAVAGLGDFAREDGPVAGGTFYVRDGSGVGPQSRYMYVAHQAEWTTEATVGTDSDSQWRIRPPYSGWKLQKNAQGETTGAQYVGWDAWLPVETKMYHWRCNRLGLAQNCVLKEKNGRLVVEFAGGKPTWYAPRKERWPDRSGKEWSARPFAGTGDIPDFPATSFVDWRFGPSMKQPGGSCLMNRLARRLLGNLGNVWTYPLWLCTEADGITIDLAAPWLQYDSGAASLLEKLEALKTKWGSPGDAIEDPEEAEEYREELVAEWGKEKVEYYTRAWQEWGRTAVLRNAEALSGKMPADFAVRALRSTRTVEDGGGEPQTVEDWADCMVERIHARSNNEFRVASAGGVLFAAPMTEDTGEDGVGIWPAETSFICKARVRNGRDTLLYNLRYDPAGWSGITEEQAEADFDSARHAPDKAIYWTAVGDDPSNQFADAVEGALENGECYGTGHVVDGLLDNTNGQNRLDLAELLPGIRVGDAFDLRLTVRSYSERVDVRSGREGHAVYDPATTALAAYVADEAAESGAFFQDSVTVGEGDDAVTHWCDWLRLEEETPRESSVTLPDGNTITARLHSLEWAGSENELEALENGLSFGESSRGHPETYFDDVEGCIVTKRPGSGDSCWRINAQWQVSLEARIVKRLPPAQNAGGGQPT